MSTKNYEQKYFCLEGETVVESDWDTYATERYRDRGIDEATEKGNRFWRRIAYDDLGDGRQVQTVFSSKECLIFEGSPYVDRLFSTAVLGPKNEIDEVGTAETYEEALELHRETLESKRPAASQQ